MFFFVGQGKRFAGESVLRIGENKTGLRNPVGGVPRKGFEPLFWP